MIKRVPNLLSLLRILLSLLLLVFAIPKEKNITAFIIVFLLCGISDMLDGYIARRFNVCSPFGAKLDAYADAQYIIISFICFFFTVKEIPITWYMVVYLVAGILLKLANYVITWVRFKVFNGVHTYLNKSVGSLLGGVLLLSIALGEVPIWLQFIAITGWYIAAIDEMIVLLKASEFDTEAPGILGRVIKVWPGH